MTFLEFPKICRNSGPLKFSCSEIGLLARDQTSRMPLKLSAFDLSGLLPLVLSTKICEEVMWVANPTGLTRLTTKMLFKSYQSDNIVTSYQLPNEKLLNDFFENSSEKSLKKIENLDQDQVCFKMFEKPLLKTRKKRDFLIQVQHIFIYLRAVN